jgi:hypothetical protein
VLDFPPPALPKYVHATTCTRATFAPVALCGRRVNLLAIGRPVDATCPQCVAQLRAAADPAPASHPATVPASSVPASSAPAVPIGRSAAPHVDAILSPLRARVPRTTSRLYGSARSKAIRDVFRAIGWGKFFSVTKGGHSLGTSIDWAKGFSPVWSCEEHERRRQDAGRAHLYVPVPVCLCATCKRRQAQRDAVRRRVHYVLNQAFADGREFGDRSDTMSDYFDADYTFHP